MEKRCNLSVFLVRCGGLAVVLICCIVRRGAGCPCDCCSPPNVWCQNIDSKFLLSDWYLIGFTFYGSFFMYSSCTKLEIVKYSKTTDIFLFNGSGIDSRSGRVVTWTGRGPAIEANSRFNITLIYNDQSGKKEIQNDLSVIGTDKANYIIFASCGLPFSNYGQIWIYLKKPNQNLSSLPKEQQYAIIDDLTRSGFSSFTMHATVNTKCKYDEHADYS